MPVAQVAGGGGEDGTHWVGVDVTGRAGVALSAAEIQSPFLSFRCSAATKLEQFQRERRNPIFRAQR